MRLRAREKFYEDSEGTTKKEGSWLVLYDFQGIKPSTKFWTNLNRLIKMARKGSLIQHSVFHSSDFRAVIAASRLARHYGATVAVYKVEEVLDFY